MDSSSDSLTKRDFVTASIGIVAGLAISTIAKFARRNLRSQSRQLLTDSDDSDDEEDDELAESSEPYKLILCVRIDLKMQKGKIAAQAGHATLGAYKTARRRQPQSVAIWEAQAQPKIAVQISSREQATRLQNAAKRLNLVTYALHDAGRTQVAAGSMTVLAIGPGPASLVNQVTGSLKLL